MEYYLSSTDCQQKTWTIEGHTGKVKQNFHNGEVFLLVRKFRLPFFF